MTIQNALSIWDWSTAIGLVVAGVTIGIVFHPYAWPTMRYPVFVAGTMASPLGCPSSCSSSCSSRSMGCRTPNAS